MGAHRKELWENWEVASWECDVGFVTGLFVCLCAIWNWRRVSHTQGTYAVPLSRIPGASLEGPQSASPTSVCRDTSDIESVGWVWMDPLNFNKAGPERERDHQVGQVPFQVQALGPYWSSGESCCILVSFPLSFSLLEWTSGPKWWVGGRGEQNYFWKAWGGCYVMGS